MHRSSAPLRLDVLDGLRGIAILLVLAYHASLVSGWTPGVPVLDALVRTGYLGVDLFFALSGFCMLYPLACAYFANEPLPGWGHYAYRRAVKIVPSYLLVLGAFAALYATRLGNNLVPALLTHLTFTHPLVRGEFRSISGPLWTVGLEVQFYCVFPLLCGIVLRWPYLAAGLVALIAADYRLAVSFIPGGATFFWTSQLPAYLDVFAAGIFAAYVVAWYRLRARQLPRPAATWIAAASLLASLAGVIAIAHSPAMDGPAAFYAWGMHWRFAIAGALFVLLASCALAAPQVGALIGNPVLAFFALISYNLYLWQLEVLVQGSRFGIPIYLSVAAAIAIAALITYGLERPLLFARIRALQPGAARPRSRPAAAR